MADDRDAAWRDAGIHALTGHFQDWMAEAFATLGRIGFEVERPRGIRLYTGDAYGGGAHYNPSMDILLVKDVLEKSSKQKIIAQIEHELLHKWQYDGRSFQYPPGFDDSAAMLEEAWITEVAPGPYGKPEPVDEDDIERAARAAVLREELDRARGHLDERRDELRSEASDIKRELDIEGVDDPARRERLQQRLEEIKPEIDEVDEKRRELGEEVEAELGVAVEQVLEPVWFRVDYCAELEQRVGDAGEAVSYLWYYYRVEDVAGEIDDLDNRADVVSDLKDKMQGGILAPPNYAGSLENWFNKIYDRYERHRQTRQKEDAVVEAMNDFKPMFFKQQRMAYQAIRSYSSGDPTL